MDEVTQLRFKIQIRSDEEEEQSKKKKDKFFLAYFLADGVLNHNSVGVNGGDNI